MKFKDLVGCANPSALWRSGNWCGVVSSNIAAIYWIDGTLLVRFRNDSVYAYSDVPETVALALASAKSVGRAFNALIKPVYLCEKIDNQEPYMI